MTPASKNTVYGAASKQMARQVLNVREAAAYLGVGEYTIREMIRRRIITPLPLGTRSIRIARATLDELINGCTQSGTLPASCVDAPG